MPEIKKQTFCTWTKDIYRMEAAGVIFKALFSCARRMQKYVT